MRRDRSLTYGELFTIFALLLVLVLLGMAILFTKIYTEETQFNATCKAHGGTPYYGGRGASNVCLAPGAVVPIE